MSALSVFSEAHPTDDKYKSLAEAYQSASSWTPDDKFSPSWPYSLTQRYLPGITEYCVRTAREHGKNTGRRGGGGSAVLLSKSPRMRVNYAQLDHYLEFYYQSTCSNRPAFGQRLLSLADGSLLKTPNLITTMIPERIVAQYILSIVRKSTLRRSADQPCCVSCPLVLQRYENLQGVDYIAADGGKAFPGPTD